MMSRRRSIPLLVAVLALVLAAPSLIHAATLSPHGVLDAVKVSADATAVPFDDSQFRVTGSCVDNGGGDFTAQPYIKSKHANAPYFISNGSGQDLDLDPSDGRIPFGATHVATGADPDFEARDYDVEVYAVSASGKALIARVATGVHVRGADCLFSGLLQHS